MSRKNAGKNSPDSISQIAALILMALGTLFSVLGLLGYVLDLPMKAGEARGFLPMGLVILAVGGACDLWARSKSRPHPPVDGGTACSGRNPGDPAPHFYHLE